MVESIYFLKPAWCGTHFAGLRPEQGLQPVTRATALRRWFVTRLHVVDGHPIWQRGNKRPTTRRSRLKQFGFCASGISSICIAASPIRQTVLPVDHGLRRSRRNLKGSVEERRYPDL